MAPLTDVTNLRPRDVDHLNQQLAHLSRAMLVQVAASKKIGRKVQSKDGRLVHSNSHGIDLPSQGIQTLNIPIFNSSSNLINDIRYDYTRLSASKSSTGEQVSSPANGSSLSSSSAQNKPTQAIIATPSVELCFPDTLRGRATPHYSWLLPTALLSKSPPLVSSKLLIQSESHQRRVPMTTSSVIRQSLLPSPSSPFTQNGSIISISSSITSPSSLYLPSPHSPVFSTPSLVPMPDSPPASLSPPSPRRVEMVTLRPDNQLDTPRSSRRLLRGCLTPPPDSSEAARGLSSSEQQEEDPLPTSVHSGEEVCASCGARYPSVKALAEHLSVHVLQGVYAAHWLLQAMALLPSAGSR